MSRKSKKPKQSKKPSQFTQSFVKAIEQAFQQTKFCFTEGCTAQDFQKCHVLSESSQLGHLVKDKSGYVAVISPSPGKQFNTSRSNIWEFKKIPTALTFTGFCNACDTKLFLNADRAKYLNVRLVDELNLRAFCYNSWWRVVNIRANETIITNKGIPYAQFPPLTFPLSAHIKNFEDERDYFGKTMVSGIRKLLNYHSTNETNFINYSYKIAEEIPFCYSACTYLTTNIFCGLRPLDWKTSVEPPIWFIHLIKVDNETQLIFSFEEKFRDIVESDIQILENLEPSELSRLLVQYFIINNLGLVCSSDMAKQINNSKYFTTELKKGLLARERGATSSENWGIPSDDFQTCTLTLGSKLEIK